MKKWASAAVIYMVVILAGYNIYTVNTNQNSTPAEPISEHSHHQEANSSQVDEDADVRVEVSVSGNKLTIHLYDRKDRAIEDLDINHEKLLHLIIVDDHLEQYVHLHPDQIDVGVFQTTLDLQDGSYLAYVDIKPTNLTYQVQPLPFTIGNSNGHAHDHGKHTLEPDENLTQTVENYVVTLETSKLSVGQLVQLKFELPSDVSPEPYLGALGHVVILDETSENFIHVHPTDEMETTFKTVFNQPGTYKIWAEFKFNGKVLTFPYVVEVIE